MKILFVTVILVAAAVKSNAILACGGAPAITLGDKTVQLSFVDPVSREEKTVTDDDGMFVSHYLVAYCASMQKIGSTSLECWPKISGLLQKSALRLEKYFGQEYLSEIDKSQLTSEEKQEQKALALKRASFWKATREKASRGMDLASFREFMQAEEFRSGMEHSFTVSQRRAGQKPYQTNATINEINGMLGFYYEDLPSVDTSRCARAEASDFMQIAHLDWVRGDSVSRGIASEPKPADKE